MIIIASKAGQGRSNEMIRRFMDDSRMAIYITDEFSLGIIGKKMQRLKVKYRSGETSREFKAISAIGKDLSLADYFKIIGGYEDYIVYLDLSLSPDLLQDVKLFCKGSDMPYKDHIHMTHQLNANSNIEGVQIYEEF